MSKNLAPGLEERHESLLTKMFVTRQNLAHVAVSHDEHRNTIGEAVTFVGAVVVEVYALHEQTSSVINHFYIVTKHNRPHVIGCLDTVERSKLRKGIKGLNQDNIRRDPKSIVLFFGNPDCLLMVLVSRVNNGNPKSRIHENQFHFRLGVP